MYRLTDAYNADGATPLATAVMAIGSALVFSLGLFLILNANDHKLASQLKHALSAIDSQGNDPDKTGEFGTLTVSGESNLSGDITADSDLTVGGSTTLSGDLSVGGKAAVNTVLAVDGDTSLGSTLAVQGKTSLGGDLDVAGSTSLQAELFVAGDTNFDGGLQLTHPVHLGGSLDVAGSSSITGGLAVVGDTTFDGSATTPDGSRFLGIALALQGSAAIGGDFETDGATTVSGALGVSGDAVFDGSITDAGVTRLLATIGFMLQGSANIGGDFEADGVSQIQGNLNVTSADSSTVFDASQVNAGNTALLAALGFSVNGAVTLAGDLEVDGTSVLKGTLAVTGVDSTTTFNGTGTDALNATSLLCNLGVTNANHGCNTFTVQGTTAPNKFAGDFEVDGTALIKGLVNVSGVDSSTTFNGTGTDALGTTTTLLCNLGVTNPNPYCNTFTIQGVTAPNTFAGDLEVDGTALIKGLVTVSGLESNTTFNGTGTDSVGTTTTTTLLCNLGANPNPNCTTFTIQGTTAANTFAGDFEVDGVAVIAGTISVSNSDTSNEPTTTFNGTGSAADGTTTTLLCNLSANPNFACTTFGLQGTGANTFAGDFEVNGISNIAGTISVGNSDTSNEPTTTFNGTGTTADGTTTTLLCNLSANPNFACTTFGLQGTGANTFAGDFEVNGTSNIAGTINVTSPDANIPSTITFNGTGTDAAGNTTLLCNPGANPNCTTFYVQGAVSLSGDAEFDGTSFLNSTLSVSGSADFEGDLRVQCYSGPSGCVNTGPVTVGGNVTVDNTLNAYSVIGTNNVSSAEFRYNDGVNPYKPGTTYDCTGTANTHIEVSRVGGGIITAGNGGTCVRNQVSGTDGTVCGTNLHVGTLVLDHGTVTSVTCTAGADYAENYDSTQNLSAGDVVAIDTSNSEYVVKTITAADSLAIGVVSTQPGETIGSATGYPIALSGRVPVKVTNEGGAIAAGDYLTSASTAGYAKKAVPGEKTIGQALEAFTGTTGTVKMFVNVSPSQTSMQTILQAANSVQQSGAASLAGLNVTGPTTLTDLTVTGTATINNLTVSGVATVANLTVNGHIVGNDDTRGSITIPKNAKTIHHDFTTAYAKTPAVVASPTSQAVLYTVTPSATGFNINLPVAATADISFNYLVEE